MDEKKATTKAAHENQKHQRHYTATRKPYLDFGAVRMAAYGRWDYIHRTLGVHLQTTSHRKHTPCPACGGRDRFRVLPEYQETGNWFCGGGGNQQTGDGFALLSHAFNWDSYQQFSAVGELLGVAAPNAETRMALRQQAEKYEAMMQAKVRQKDERRRLDVDLIDALRNFDETLEFRQRAQQAVKPQFVDVMRDEVQAAKVLARRLVESYAGVSHG
ncbi:MAG: hypothetical protein E6Q85_06205 [Thiothrix sp.]|nr:MAG: hypothetical protein E6Q85_06205 [Thiothrix sp.]